MNEVEELKFDSTLWATPVKLVNLLDFKPEKLSIKTENDLPGIKVHQVRYENGGFYLTIDNIKGYFSLNKTALLNTIFPNDDQKNKYYQVWKEIFKIVDNENGELNLHEKIVLSDIDIYTDKIIKISSVTIVIKSLIEKDNKFYLELIELIFLKALTLKNVKKHLENVIKFYYFLDKNFKYGPYLCDGCYMSLKAVSIKNLAIINHNGNHYRVNFTSMSKKDAYNLIKNAVIMGEKGIL